MNTAKDKKAKKVAAQKEVEAASSRTLAYEGRPLLPHETPYGQLCLFASDKGIAVDIEHGGRSPSGKILNAHIHAYAPEGMKFGPHDLHEVSLGDWPCLNYKQALATLKDALPLVLCEDLECEYCNPE